MIENKIKDTNTGMGTPQTIFYQNVCKETFRFRNYNRDIKHASQLKETERGSQTEVTKTKWGEGFLPLSIFLFTPL